MIPTIVGSSQFDAIHSYLKDEQVKLLITDFNGVLDDYYRQKYTLLSNVLGEDNQHLLAALAVFTDTEYLVNHNATLEQSIDTFFTHHGIEQDAATQAVLLRDKVASSLTDEAHDFLTQLAIPYVIYTSQNAATMKQSLRGLHADVYSRDRTGREKPSIQNLEMILRDYDMSPEQVCVIGDGLIDDLMPARLIGMKTILISPFAHTLHTVS